MLICEKVIMVLADLGRKITSALKSLSNATVINEEVNMLCCQLTGEYAECLSVSYGTVVVIKLRT